VPHFHIPLQSGNNQQLSQMRRRYRRELYAERVATIKRLMPHCCIGADLIVGFPGETDADFRETYRFVQEELDVSYLHVFTYSERANTPAAEMPDPVPMAVRRERNEQLRILSEKKRRAFYAQHLGQTRQVLFEAAESPEGTMSGFTDNYLKVTVPYRAELVNRTCPVRLEHLGADSFLVSEPLLMGV
jgi:threonylcarbamoyladenosine tRNA methylthiotransferase MtaB